MSARDEHNGDHRKPGGTKRYGRPAGAGDKPRARTDENATGKPSEARPPRRYAKPAVAGDKPPRRFGKPANPTGDRPQRSAPFARTDENATGKPGEARPPRRFDKPAVAGDKPPRRFDKPAGTTGDRPQRSAPRAPARPGVRRAPAETPNARYIALQTLLDVHRDGAYAQLALQKRLAEPALQSVDHRFITSLVYATIENRLKLDFALDRLIERPVEEPELRDILRLSACQLFYMDRVPESAAVNEGVKLCRAVGMEGSAGFVNAVLRNLIRGKDDIPWPKREDDLRAYLSVEGSMPLWIVDKLLAAYPGDVAEELILYRRQTHDTVVRPNMLLMNDAAFEKLLTQRGYAWRRGVAPHAYRIENAGDLARDPGYRDGLFSIQGESSLLAAEAVQAAAGMRVLDACAAPGGKAAYMAESMQNTGRVFAWELHEKRALLLESTKRRLKLENMRVSVRDALEPRPDMTATLDAVLLDAPCSGLGVMAEKPDIKYRVKPEDVPVIAQTQSRLLDALCGYLKPNGVLVYSTCSILPEENLEQVAAFLERHPDFVMEPLPLSYPEALRLRQTPLGLQLLGYRDGVEGFFIARMRKAKA